MNRHVCILISWFLLVLSSCASDPTKGYAALGPFPSTVSKMAIPIFTNETYVRDVEFELTDALIKEVELQTPYKVTAEADADTILLGQVRNIQLDHLSKSRVTGLTEEVIVSVTIDFQWKDLRTGRVMLERRSFSGHGLFVPSRPSSEPIELGQFAVVQQLARDVVNEMRAPW